MLNFIKKYNSNVIKFVQNRNLISLPDCKYNYNIGIGLLKIGNVILFGYEHISNWFGEKLYDENYIVNEQVHSGNHSWLAYHPLNVFRYSTLEIYKQINN